MKRKFIDKEDWPRVTEKRFKCTYINNEEFNGYVSTVYIDKVKEPLNVSTNGKEFCLADEGYIWLQHVPLKRNYALTTMYNSNKEIVQWYFDICKPYEISESGVPFFQDLYLDVVVLPSGKVILLDQHELSHALKSGAISEKEYSDANKQATLLIEDIKNGTNDLLQFSKEYFKNI